MKKFCICAFVAEVMAARSGKSVPRRVQWSNKQAMHDMVLEAIGRCKTPTGHTQLQLFYELGLLKRPDSKK